MKKTLFFFATAFCIYSNAQNLLFENFSSLNNAQLNGQNGWSNSTSSGFPGLGACAGAVCQNTPIANRAMSFTNFQTTTKALNPINNSNGDGVGKFLSSSVRSGSVYVALLANFSSLNASSNGSQVFRLMDSSFTTATRLYAKSLGASFALAVDKTGGVASGFTSSNYAFNTDVLIVLKYTFNTGSTIDDAIRIYVNPDLNMPEPTLPDLSYTSGGTQDANSITRIVFPWNGSNIPTGFIGAVSISSSWGTTLPSPFVSNLSLNKTSNKSASLNWEVSNNNELNNFTVQQSTNNKDFTNVARIEYNGNRTFSQPINLQEGINFIRLATTNKQGAISYSQVLTTKYGSLNLASFSLSPNPTKGNLLVSLKSDKADNQTFIITDMQGRLITQQVRKIEKGESTITIDANNLKTGNYILKTIINNTQVSQLFIKE
ncbi:MAG: T9SS type A sorting domain-containing protein [Chitinophagaceae bacterium]